MLRMFAAALVLVGAMLGRPPSADAQAPRVLNLKLAADGLVTLTAQGVTVREILAEWARQCGCFVVNADRLNGAPLAVPVTFSAASQSDVLRSLLRETGGYALTPRRAGSTSLSQYETIYIISASGPVAYAGPTTTSSFTPIAIRTAPDDEIPPVVPIVVGAEQPAAGAIPAEQTGPQGQGSRPGAPAGGFVITPVTPVTSSPGTPTTMPGTSPALPASPTMPGTPTTAPGQPTQPGRVTPAPQP